MEKRKIRLAMAGETGRKRMDFHQADPAAVQAHVGETLALLERLIDKAAAAGCDLLAFPEDTLGLLHWFCANSAKAEPVFRDACDLMLERFGAAAKRNRMYVLCCEYAYEMPGKIYNTAYFLGRDGREIGRYHKVNVPFGESTCVSGDAFPVFETPDLGGVGMLICYDMVFPETIRCLAMNGADIVFHLTMGGPNFGDSDLVRAGYRIRAVDNLVYLGVAFSNQSVIISPRGEVLAECQKGQDLVIADIDPQAGREASDSANKQKDMRARLFRERRPDAYAPLTMANPPILAKLAPVRSREESARIMEGMLTVGEDQFAAAELLMKEGKAKEAAREFERLCREYPDTWIDSVSAQRLAGMKAGKA